MFGGSAQKQNLCGAAIVADSQPKNINAKIPRSQHTAVAVQRLALADLDPVSTTVIILSRPTAAPLAAPEHNITRSP